MRTYWKTVHENSESGGNPQEVHLYLSLIDPRYFDLIPYILADGTSFAEGVLICPLSLQYVYSLGRFGAEIAAVSKIGNYAKPGPIEWLSNKKYHAKLMLKSMWVDWANYRLRNDPDFLGSNRASTSKELEEFHWHWEQNWFDCAPIGHHMRGNSESTYWLRLHNLPESKQYPDTVMEYQEIEYRQLALIEELCTRFDSSPDKLLVITPAVSTTETPTRRETSFREILPEARCWQSMPYDLSDRKWPTWRHVFVSEVSLNDARMRQLLRAVVDEKAWDVIICPPTLEWVFHPYDGGNDIVSINEEFTDVLREKHKSWLPSEPSGM